MSAKNRVTRRQFLQTTAVAVAGSFLAACAVPVAPQPSEPAAAGELIELTHIMPDRELGKNVNNVYIETFNQKMADEGQPWRMSAVVGPATDTDLLTKITLDAAAGTLADVVQGETQWVADFIAAGYVYDLTDLISGWEDWEHYYPILRELATFDGRIMGVPGGTTISWFYRKDVLEQADISTEQPNTWEDFYAVCGEIKEKTTAQPCGLPAATAWGGGTWGEGFKMVWLSFEGTIYDEADQKWVVSSPNLLKAFQVYETLAKNEWLTVQELLTPNPWEPIKYQEFPQGETVLVTGGDWQWQFDWGPNGATPIEGLFEKVDRWLFSAETGEPFVFVRGGVNTWINAKSVAPEGAFEYLKHRDTPEVACETYPLYLGGPAGRDDTGERCEFYRNAVNGKMVEADGFFETGRTLRTYVGETKIADGVARATEDIITLKRTAEEAMSDFAQAMKDALGEDMVKDA